MSFVFVARRTDDSEIERVIDLPRPGLQQVERDLTFVCCTSFLGCVVMKTLRMMTRVCARMNTSEYSSLVSAMPPRLAYSASSHLAQAAPNSPPKPACRPAQSTCFANVAEVCVSDVWQVRASLYGLVQPSSTGSRSPPPPPPP